MDDRFYGARVGDQNFSAERKRPAPELATHGPSLSTTAPTASKRPPSTKTPPDEREFVHEYMCWRSCTPRARSSKTWREMSSGRGARKWRLRGRSESFSAAGFQRVSSQLSTAGEMSVSSSFASFTMAAMTGGLGVFLPYRFFR